ncbi:MAG: GAF domain-containing protein [Anaerolineae bacterium]|nr:GAF domain-containing protein [Anaerolineae bacterium]
MIRSLNVVLLWLMLVFWLDRLADVAILGASLAPIIPILGLVQNMKPASRGDDGDAEASALSLDAGKLLQQYGQDLITTPLKTDAILERLVKQIESLFEPTPNLVFLRNSTKNVFTFWSGQSVSYGHTIEIQFGLDDDLAEWLTNTRKILTVEQPASRRSKKSVISQEELARLKMLDIAVCVPLIASGVLLGWLALGRKKGEAGYETEDRILLSSLANQTSIALENAQHLEQANRRAAELEALHKISAEIQAEAHPDRLLALTVEQATNLLHAQGGLVLLQEPPGQDTLKVVVSHNLDRDYCSVTIGLGEGVAGQVIAQDRSITIDNYQHFKNRAAPFDDATFGAVLGVPLRWGGKVQGVLQLVHAPRGAKFNQHDVWLIEFFATQSALALEKSRLLQEAQTRASHLDTLTKVSMDINATLDLDTALMRIMNQAVKILKAEAGSLLLVDATGKDLVFKVVLGPTGRELLGMTTPIGKGIVGTVAQTGTPLIINDVATDPRWNVAFDEATDFQTKDILCVPMVAHDQQVVGVIELINKSDGTAFSDADSSLLVSFAAQAAIAIENARVFTQTDKALAERVQNLQAVQMFDRQLQTSLELDTVLDITLNQIMDALGLSMGLIGILKNGGDEGLYLLAQRGMPTEMGRYRIDPWPLTRGVIGQVVRSGELAWINDLSQAKNYVPKNHRTRSMLIVPITRELEERVVGVIDLESTDPDYFTSDDVAFVRLMASHAAIAIENAQLFEQVRHANEAKSEFMRVAAHELKTPMTSIKGYTKLIQMGAVGDLTEKQADFLNIITSNVDRMDRLVQDLLDVSRIEAGRIRLEIADVQMEDVINEVVATIKTEVEKKNLGLTLEVEHLPMLRADYRRMVQIMTNLLSNAYKYTPENGDIRVTARPSNGKFQGITITVADTGYGISEEDQANLFTSFYRSSDQNIRNEPGTGLGLSITKNMIESHGGELTFESELNKGSSFTFTLPLISKIPSGVEVIER